MVKEQSFVALFAFSISTDVTAGLGGSQTFTKNVLEALSFCESFSSQKDDFALKLALEASNFLFSSSTRNQKVMKINCAFD